MPIRPTILPTNLIAVLVVAAFVALVPLPSQASAIAVEIAADTAAEAAAPAPGTTTPITIAAIERPVTLGTVSGIREIALGRGVLRIPAGGNVRVLGVGGKPAGLWVPGASELVYRVEDRFSVPVARRNLKRASRLRVTEAGGVLTVTTAVQEALIWGWGALPAGATIESGGKQSEPGLAYGLAARKSFPEPGRHALLAERHGDLDYRYAILSTSGETLLLEHDPRPAHRIEQLSRLMRFEIQVLPDDDRRATFEELAAQPVGRQWWDPVEPEFAVVETRISIVEGEKERGTIDATSKIQVLREGLRAVTFDLDQGHIDPDKRFFSHLAKAVTVAGQPATWSHDAGALVVELPRAMKRGETLEIATRIETALLYKLYGDHHWSFHPGPWYPTPTDGGIDWGSMRFEVDTPAKFLAFAPGTVVSRSSAGGRNHLTTTLKGPAFLPGVIAGELSPFTEEADGRKVTVATYAYDKEDSARRVGRNVIAVQQCLEDWLGVPYPFSDLQVVEINEWGWAQAPPGMIFLTQEALLTGAQIRANSELRSMAKRTVPTVDLRLAHEVAHAWFPHIVQIRSNEEDWLSESFADYVSAVCIERVMGADKKGKDNFATAIWEWKNFVSNLEPGTSIYLASHLAGGSDENAWMRVRLLYGKGPLVLHALRQELARQLGGPEQGDRIFFGWIQLIVKNFDRKLATTRNATEILNKLTQKDWHPWFEKYVYGDETPTIE